MQQIPRRHYQETVGRRPRGEMVTHQPPKLGIVGSSPAVVVVLLFLLFFLQGYKVLRLMAWFKAMNYVWNLTMGIVENMDMENRHELLWDFNHLSQASHPSAVFGSQPTYSSSDSACVFATSLNARP